MLPEHVNSPGAKPEECPAALRRAGKWLAHAIVVVAASVPLFVSAQAVNGHNVKYVKEAAVHWIETDVGRWLGNADAFTEMARNETSVRLKRVSDGMIAELDVAKREVRISGPNYIGAPRPIVGAWTVSGFTANYVHIVLFTVQYPTDRTKPPTLNFVGAASWTELFENGASKGWRIDQTQSSTMPVFSATLPTSAVTRTWDTISFPESALTGARRMTIDVTTGACQFAGYHCQMQRSLAVTGDNVGQIVYREANPHGAQYPPLLGKLVKTSNTGDWTMETGNANLLKWKETARNLEYVEMSLVGTAARSRFHVNGTAQDLNGTTWQTRPDAGVSYVAPVWKGQLGTIFAPVSPGISPGFQIQNKTDYPVLVTLEQIGCLYYGIVQPGQIFQRNTGAVWFTIKASMAPDLTEPTVASCIRKPAMYAATIAVAGLTTIGTGGMGTALVVPAMLATAAGQGAAIGAQSALVASGATATEGMSGKVGIATLMRGAAVVGFTMLSSPGGAGSLALNPTVLSAIASIGGTEIYSRYTEQSDIDGLGGQLTQEASVAGAYAGYPWPWKMVDRVMPRYDITGGPRIRTLPDGSTIVLKQEHALTITRVN
jgi:hypothetical protein